MGNDTAMWHRLPTAPQWGKDPLPGPEAGVTRYSLRSWGRVSRRHTACVSLLTVSLRRVRELTRRCRACWRFLGGEEGPGNHRSRG